jgi:integrase
VRVHRAPVYTENFKYLSDDQLAELIAGIPDPDQATGGQKLKRLRNLLMISMMALQGLRTIEVHRANVFYDAAMNAGLRPDNPAAGVKSPRMRYATEDFKYLCDEELAKLLSVVPDPNQTTGREKVRRLRNLVMIGMMALYGLRTIEVQRANVEDLADKGENFALLARGKIRDRVVYLRPDTGGQIKEYVALRGEVAADADGTPLFSAISRHYHRLTRACIRAQTVQCLRLAGLKRPGISNHASRHTAAILGYLHTGDLRAVQELLGHADPRMTARYAHLVDMAKKNPALFIPVKVG